MKTFFEFSLPLMFLFATTRALGVEAEFHGNFAQTKIEGSAQQCANIFAKENYTTRHVWFGPSGLTSVLNFEQVENEADGFFTGMTIVGNIGYDDDVMSEKSFEKDGSNYNLTLQGMVNTQVIYITIKVTFLNGSNETVCDAVSEYTGFN